MNLEDMYFAVVTLLRYGKLMGCDTIVPVVVAEDYKYGLAIHESWMSLIDLSDDGHRVAVIPWESQLGGALCAAFLSEPLSAKPASSWVE